MTRIHTYLVPLLLLPTLAHALSCYVCATGNLDEFGECQSAFQYDCSGYASRFSTQENVYCRTTREKWHNGTYTVSKECITETDHYKMFPDKGYPLNEECDLVDVNGQEVAYCVCRSSMCNSDPIAEQFMSFEEKHPELFGDVETAAPSQQPIPIEAPTLELPQKPSRNSIANAFAAPQLTPPAIVPVNDPRFSIALPPALPSADVRRQQLPSRNFDETFEIGKNQGVPPRDDLGMFNLPKTAPVSQSGFVGTVGRDSKLVVARPPAPKSTAASLHCMQCGERGLSTENDDCRSAISIACDEQDTMCFTRLIVVGPGQHAVEKMCVSPAAVNAMFGEDAVGNQCGEGSHGKEHYCTCTTNECNKMSITEQKSLYSPPPAPEVPTVPPFVAARLHPTPPGPQLVPDLPAASLPDRSIITAKKKEDAQVAPKLPEQPSRPAEPKIADLQPIVPEVVHKPKETSPRCSSCSQSEMADPTADCTRMSTVECPRMGIDSMCITKQTQQGEEFTMEKGCLSRDEFQVVVPSEEFEEGCATSDGGMINFCLCTGDQCNSQSLLQQAQLNGVREALSPSVPEPVPEPPAAAPAPAPEDELPVVAAAPSPHGQRPVFRDNDGIETPKMPEHSLSDLGMSPEERELMLRRQEWAEADLSSANISGVSLLIVSVTLLFVL